MTDMKLFVWVEPYSVRYGSSMVFAIARDVDEARKIAAGGNAFVYWSNPQITPTVFLGEPDRVVDLPCAEWHEWSE